MRPPASLRLKTLFCVSACLLVPTSAAALDPFTNASSTLNNHGLSSGVALAVTDMNADGLDDIVRLDNTVSLEIEYQQPDGSFSPYAFGSIPGYAWAIAIADVDGNGYADIFSGGAYDGLKVLLANDDGTDFELTTLTGPQVFVQCTNFADIDNDGNLDLFVCHDDGLSAPFRGNGAGGFSYDLDLINAASTVPSDNSGNYGSIWSDYDNDGDLDLYIAKCRLGVNNPLDGRRTNLLFQNDGAGGFTEVAEQAGLRPLAQSWAADFADIDNDGDLDAFLINHDITSQLFRNEGPANIGQFTDITAAAGMSSSLGSLGLGIQAHFEDFDNDGFVDLLVTGRSGTHRLFLNGGDGTFAAMASPFPTGGPGIQSAVVGDLDDDGFPDVMAGFATGFNEPSNGNPDRLFLNPGNTNNFVNVRLTGVASNRSAVGARVEISGSFGQQVREIRAGESYGIHNTLTRHFGIGVADTVDTLTIRWPSGAIDTIDNPPINTTHHVTEGCVGVWFADADGDGFGDPDATTTGCIAPPGYVGNGTDCADDNAANFPGNAEVCDEADNNCDGEADEGLGECGVVGSSSGEGSGDGPGSTSGELTTGPETTTDASGSTAGGDGGTSTTTTTTTATSTTTTSSSTSGAAEEDGDSGCGCRSTRSGGEGGLALFLLAGAVRRRRRA